MDNMWRHSYHPAPACARRAAASRATSPQPPHAARYALRYYAAPALCSRATAASPRLPPLHHAFAPLPCTGVLVLRATKRRLGTRCACARSQPTLLLHPAGCRLRGFRCTPRAVQHVAAARSYFATVARTVRVAPVSCFRIHAHAHGTGACRSRAALPFVRASTTTARVPRALRATVCCREDVVFAHALRTYTPPHHTARTAARPALPHTHTRLPVLC